MIETLAPPDQTDRNWGLSAHLSALFGGMVLPFGNIVGPLIVYLQNRDSRPFATGHAKAALNFQITLAIVFLLVLVVAGLGWLGFLGAAIAAPSGSGEDAQFPPFAIAMWLGVGGFMVVVGIVSIVWTILGAVAASQGRTYRYPVSMYFVK